MIAGFVPQASTAMLDWALAYAMAGMAVFPCNAKKEPLIKGGFKNASTDPQTIRTWWAWWPHAEIGWAIPAEIVVVDLDCKRGDNGARDFIVHEGVRPDDVMTPQAATTSGGRHLVYSANGSVYRNNV